MAQIFDHLGNKVSNFSYKGARSNPRENDFFTGFSSINQREEKVLSEGDRVQLLSNLRNSYRNNIITSGIVDCLQTNIGKVQIQSKTDNEEFNIQKEKLFKNYLQNCEITNLDLGSCLKLIIQELALAGDCLIVLLKNGKIQLIPSERISSSQDPSKRKADEINGVRVNKLGAITHFRVVGFDANGNINKDQGTYISAKDGIFIRNLTRIGSLRGIPMLASSMNALQSIEEIQASYTMKIKVNSLFACAITSNSPYDERWSLNNMDEASRSSFTKIEPMSLLMLENGEDIKTIDASSGVSEVEKYLLFLVNFVASPILGCPEAISGFSSSTFASSRVTKTQSNHKFKQYRELMEDQFLRRFVNWKTSKAVKFGDLDEIDHKDSTNFNWSYLPVLDKQKEIQMDKMAIDNNLASYTEIFAEKGRDFAEEAQQIAKDKLLLEELMNKEKESSLGASPDLSNQDSEDIKKKIEAYGVGVRGGSITPQQKDEDYFRESLDLPKAEKPVLDAWEDDGGARRPITLKSQEAFESEQSDIAENSEEENQDQEKDI
nr:phage portal protein, lambda family (TIGR01539) [uncultured Mediterranean phage uvMED]